MIEIHYKFRADDNVVIRRIITIGYGKKEIQIQNMYFINVIDEFINKKTQEIDWATHLWHSDYPFKRLYKKIRRFYV